MMIPRIKLQKIATMMPTITRTPPTPMPPANLPPRLLSMAIRLLLPFAVCGPQAVPVRTLSRSTDASLGRRARASSKSPCVTDAGAESFEPVRVIAASAASCASDLRSAGEKVALRVASAAKADPLAHHLGAGDGIERRARLRREHLGDGRLSRSGRSREQ